MKRKGAAFNGNCTPKNSPNSLIVRDAAAQSLIRDIPPEITIRSCHDLVRFCSITTISKKTGRILLRQGRRLDLDGYDLLLVPEGHLPTEGRSLVSVSAREIDELHPQTRKPDVVDLHIRVFDREGSIISDLGESEFWKSNSLIKDLHERVSKWIGVVSLRSDSKRSILNLVRGIVGTTCRDMGGLVRWYHAEPEDAEGTLFRENITGRLSVVSDSGPIGIAMDIEVGSPLPENLDLSWYIGEARALIQSDPRYHHRSRRLLKKHPEATRMVDLGLVPCPKWKGKAQPKGSDRSRPTLLWAWWNYSTFGAYTGWTVKVLVLDLDLIEGFLHWVKYFKPKWRVVPETVDGKKIRKVVEIEKIPPIVPGFEDRMSSFIGALCSYRGDSTPEGVRAGRDRGKLCFKLDLPEGHPISKISNDTIRLTHGFEVFYGPQGIPTLLGEHPDGTRYEIDGTLTRSDEWMIEGLTALAPKPTTTKKSSASTPHTEVDPDSDGPLPLEVVEPLMDRYLEILQEIDPMLDGELGWEQKRDSRGAWGRRSTCPFPENHGPSRTSNPSSLWLSVADNYAPVLKCMHNTCTRIPEIQEELRRRVREDREGGPRWPGEEPTDEDDGSDEDGPQEASERALDAVEVPSLELTPLATAYRDPTHGLVSLHVAPMGSGKSFGYAQAATMSYREGRVAVVIHPTIPLCEETIGRLSWMAPDAVAAGAVSRSFGLSLATGGSKRSRDRDEEEDDSDDATTKYPIEKSTRIIVCCHAQLQRRGFSLFNRGFLTAVGAILGEVPERLEVDIFIDETAALIRSSTISLDMSYRYTTQTWRDKSGGTLIPCPDCPLGRLGKRGGGCETCHDEPLFGVGHNYGQILGEKGKFKLPQLIPPQPLRYTIGPDGEKVLVAKSEPGALVIPPDMLILDPEEPELLGQTTFFSKVIGYREGDRVIEVGKSMWNKVPLYPYQREGDGADMKVTPIAILKHMLALTHHLTVVEEHPIDETTGEAISASEMRRRRESDGKDWGNALLPPRESCEVRRLRGNGVLPFVLLQRFQTETGARIVFADAGPTQDQIALLRDTFPDLTIVSHPTPRKIRQVLVVAVTGRGGPLGLLDPEGHLVTRPLESHGRGLIYLPTYENLQSLEEEIDWGKNPTVRSFREGTLRRGFDDEIEVPWRTIVTSGRGSLGIGINIENLAFLFVDARSYRYEGGFAIGEITAEELSKIREEERVSVLLQNVGRGLRGDETKLLVLVVRNAGTEKEPDTEFIATLINSRALTEGCIVPPASFWTDNLRHGVATGDAWLSQGGGDVPDVPAPEDGRPKKGRKPHAEKARAHALEAVEDSIRNGMGWVQFRDKFNVRRYFSAEEIADLKQRFAARKP